MNTNAFVGTGIAIVTPFKADLSVDYDALQNLVDFNITNGINYIVISGTTGESVTITAEEKQRITAAISEATNKRIPLVLGVGGNNTTAVINELKTTNLNQIDGILSVSPYYSKPTQQGVYEHYKAISKTSSKPIILYNVPGRTSKNIEPQTILRLAEDFENIIAVKEAAGQMQQYLQLLKDKPDDFLIISGDDDLALSTTLAGGSGVISVIAQAFPKAFSSMIHLGLQGNAKAAYKTHYELMEIINLIFSENNPAGIKALLQQLNLCNDTVRLPLVSATHNLHTKIAAYLKR